MSKLFAWQTVNGRTGSMFRFTILSPGFPFAQGLKLSNLVKVVTRSTYTSILPKKSLRHVWAKRTKKSCTNLKEFCGLCERTRCEKSLKWHPSFIESPVHFNSKLKNTVFNCDTLVNQLITNNQLSSNNLFIYKILFQPKYLYHCI